MTTFDDWEAAIEEADYLACETETDQVIRWDAKRGQFLVHNDTEAATGVFIERVRADVHPDV